MSKTNTGRVEEIDILKAIAIICMVVGHSGAPYRFIFLFHMAVFFIASGFTYKQESSDSFTTLWKSVLKKIKRLWFPFFLWSSIGTLLNNWLIHVNILTDNPDLLTYTSNITNMNLSTLSHYMGTREIIVQIIRHGLMLNTSTLFISLWFIKILFLISILYSVIDWSIKKYLHKDPLLFQLIISIIFLGIGYYLQLKKIGLWGIERTISYYHLYHIGILLNRHKNKYINWSTRSYSLVLLFSACVLIVIRFTDVASIDLAHHKYPNPFLFVVCSLSGWAFCYSLSYILKLLPIKHIFLYIGKRTMSILVFHILAFKIINGIVILIRHLPTFCLAARPHLYGDQGFLWIAYTVVGIVCPLLLRMVYEKMLALEQRQIRKD